MEGETATVTWVSPTNLDAHLRHIRPMLSQSSGQCQPDPPPHPRHQGPLARQIEQITCPVR
jgi:hypothetical protein